MSAMFSYPATAVVPADTAADFEEALPLLYAYAEWLQSVIGLPPAERQPDLRREFSDPASMYSPPRGRMLLARVGSLVRGVICVRVDESGVAELKRMYVAPEARGLGLGEVLLRDAVHAARRLGAHRIWLETSSTLMPSAFRLYKAAGFAPGRRTSSSTSRAPSRCRWSCALAARRPRAGRRSERVPAEAGSGLGHGRRAGWTIFIIAIVIVAVIAWRTWGGRDRDRAS